MKVQKACAAAKLILPVLLCAGLFAGCQTPDLKPFRDSTAKIQGSVAEAQGAYLQELERLQPYVPDNSELASQGKRFSTNWAARVAVMEAMTRYAGSLAALAAAPGDARAGLEGVSHSLKDLGALSGPYGPAVEGAVELLNEIKFLADQVLAAKHLKKAVSETNEDMQKLAQLLTLDFARMRRTLELNQRSIKNLMDGPISPQLDARRVIANNFNAYTRQLLKEMDDDNPERRRTITEKQNARTNLLEEIEDLKRQPDNPERARQLQDKQIAVEKLQKELHDIEFYWVKAIGRFNENMAEAKNYLSEADKWYLPHQAEVELARKQMAERIALFRDTENALAEWGRAHGALAWSLQNNLAPDWTLLRQSADRIEKSVNKITQQDNQP